MDSATRYLFVDEGGVEVHSYEIPNSSDIQNCGGYIDKILQYRDPALLKFLLENGVSKESFAKGQFPLLETRSPQLDLLLLRFILALRKERAGQRVSIFDLGCTVSEHFDALDLLMNAATNGAERATEALSYCGLDMAPLVLCAARQMHLNAQPEHFNLILGEGSVSDIPERGFDLALSVGVINNLKDPMTGVRKFLKSARVGAVMAMWSANTEQGFWSFSHRTTPQYFFGRQDIFELAKVNPGFRFLLAEFIPESQSTQQRHFVGITEDQLKDVGCYHLVYTNRADLFSELPEVPTE